MKEEEEERERLNIEMKAMKKQFDMIEEAKNNDDTSSIINEDDDDGDNTSNNNNNNKARNDVNNSKLNEMKNDYRQILIDFFDKHDVSIDRVKLLPFVKSILRPKGKHQ